MSTLNNAKTEVYTIESWVPGYEIRIPVSSLPDEFDEIIDNDQLQQLFLPLIVSGFEQYKACPKGYFDVDAELDYLFACADGYYEQYKDYPIVCREYNINSEIVTSKSFDLIEYFHALLADEYSLYKYEIGGILLCYLSECFEMFADNGKWNFGFIDRSSNKLISLDTIVAASSWRKVQTVLMDGSMKPVLWFGPLDQKELSPPWAMPFEGQSLFLVFPFLWNMRYLPSSFLWKLKRSIDIDTT